MCIYINSDSVNYSPVGCLSLVNEDINEEIKQPNFS